GQPDGSTVSFGTSRFTVNYTTTDVRLTSVGVATQSAVTSSLNPSTFGQTVTFTATVTPVPPATGTPTGTVTFRDGTSTLGTATLAAGSATFAATALNAGSHSITV